MSWKALSLLIVLLAVAVAHARDSDDPASAGDPSSTAPLCQGDVEGEYHGQVGSFPVLINVMCIDGERLEATLSPTATVGGHPEPLYDESVNLAFNLIDEDEVVLANFHVAPGDRANGSSKTIQSYVRVDLTSFRQAHLSGVYISGAMPDFIPLDASRTKKLPKLQPVGGTFAKTAVRGSFAVTTNSFWKDSVLVFDVLAGIPVVSFADTKSKTAVHMNDGAVWTGDGLFSVATAEGNGGEPDDLKLWYVRGRFLDANTVEFYLASPVRGIEGPLTAVRRRQPVGPMQPFARH